jgi:hypothetical protein
MNTAHEYLCTSELTGEVWLRVFGLEELDRAICVLKVSEDRFGFIYHS